MKKNLLILATLLCAAVTFSCCSSSDDNDGPGPNTNAQEAFSTQYFSIPNATFNSGALPTQTTTNQLPVFMNSSALAGGFNFVQLTSDELLKEIYVSIVGNNNYWVIDAAKALVEPTRATSNCYAFNLNFGTEFSQTVNIQICALDENGTITQPTVTTVTYVESMRGALALNLTFSNEKDVDLHLVTPFGYHIYYGNRGIYDQSATVEFLAQLEAFYDTMNNKYGEEWYDLMTEEEQKELETLYEQSKEGVMICGLDHDSNAGCSIDGLNNENIVFADEWVCNGKYEVYLDMYENCDPSTATSWSVTARYRDQVIPVNTALKFPVRKDQTQSITNSNPVSGVFEVNEPSTSGSNDTSVLSLKIMEFEITGAPKNPQDFEEYINGNKDDYAKTRAAINPWKLFLTPAEKAKVEFAEFMSSRNK